MLELTVESYFSLGDPDGDDENDLMRLQHPEVERRLGPFKRKLLVLDLNDIETLEETFEKLPSIEDPTVVMNRTLITMKSGSEHYVDGLYQDIRDVVFTSKSLGDPRLPTGLGVKRLLLDVDGVLTSPYQHIDNEGEKMFKQFHVRDIAAIRKLMQLGVDVTIVTGCEWEGARNWVENKLGARYIYTKDKSGVEPGEQSLYIGDDYYLDLDLMHKCTWALCPQNADARLRQLFPVLPVNGGQGVVSMLLEQNIITSGIGTNL